MKIICVAAAILVSTATVAAAQEQATAPKFFADTYPEQALPSAMETMGALEGEQAALEAKTRELVSLGVAAQIPCQYCIYAHTKAARAAGATEAEIREAVAAAATVRHWSTVLNGMQYDLDAFKAEYDQLVEATN